MPTALLEAHVAQMPKLSALDSLLESQRIGVGTGRLTKSARRQLLHAWQRAARQERVVLRSTSRDSHRAYMAMSGIGVKYERLEAADDG
jgi:ribose 5-phosphate isomerase